MTDIIPGTDYKIFQDKNSFSFGIDAVLLSSFARAGGLTFDFCSGNGIVALRMAYFYDVHFICLEIDPKSYELMKKSIEANNLQDRVEAKLIDIREAEKSFKKSIADVITCNPPYFDKNRSYKSNDIARTELMLNIEELAEKMDYIAKDRAKIYMIHRPGRLLDIIEAFSKRKLVLKKFRMVKPSADKKANMVLLEFVKNGGRNLDVMNELICYNEDGSISEELKFIYKGGFYVN